jgi:hypothetical protein
VDTLQGLKQLAIALKIKITDKSPAKKTTPPKQPVLKRDLYREPSYTGVYYDKKQLNDYDKLAHKAMKAEYKRASDDADSIAKAISNHILKYRVIDLENWGNYIENELEWFEENGYENCSSAIVVPKVKQLLADASRAIPSIFRDTADTSEVKELIALNIPRDVANTISTYSQGVRLPPSRIPPDAIPTIETRTWKGEITYYILNKEPRRLGTFTTPNSESFYELAYIITVYMGYPLPHPIKSFELLAIWDAILKRHETSRIETQEMIKDNNNNLITWFDDSDLSSTSSSTSD